MILYIKSSSEYDLINRIRTAAYGEDSLKYALKYIQLTHREQLEGFEYDGVGFDISYQGTQRELENSIIDTYAIAGIMLTYDPDTHSMEYDNEGQIVLMQIHSGNDDYTFTDTSNGFYISIENIYD